MHIVQIAPAIGPGSGVAGVAWNLEREFAARGHTVERFTLANARFGPSTRPPSRFLVVRALNLLGRTMWFSTVGAVRARRFIAARPGAVSLCHNAVLFGDVYVNHGVLGAAMRARGNALWRMLRNPTHVFTHLRDLIRYRSRIHRAVVVLSDDEQKTLRRTYGLIRPPVHVIAHGVDSATFRPPSPAERQRARAALHLDGDDRVALFIGHEFERKGLDVAIRALTWATTVLLLVAGGNQRTLGDARTLADRLGVADRVLFVGVRTDTLPLLWAADMFVLPSAYESFGLVITEALSAGVPVISTRVGCAPSLIVDGSSGYLVERDPQQFADRMERIAADDEGSHRDAARASAMPHDWGRTAERYLALLARLSREDAR